MCGIAGFWNARSGRPADPAALRAMVGSLAHRGPDDDGFLLDGPVGLGMRRLQVIDIAGGRQPMANEDGSIRVVFNGEIYNHRELRTRLKARGHRFRTESDTEVIPHAFEQWGADCVERFNGMFAIAVWDRSDRRLFLARDRLGIKPLYVHDGPEGIVFGSELKAVMAAPWVPLEWDLEAVDDFMTYEYVPAPRSIVRDVHKLDAGSWLLVDDAGTRRRRRTYWRPTPADVRFDSPADAARAVRARLRESVRRRLLADVPLGAFLSGGVDSGGIVALMRETGPGRPRSFSMGFADRSYDELPYARTIARRFDTVHREDVVTPDIVDLAGRLADFFDEPFADVSSFATYMISDLARRSVTVALSGDGGDELFAGYDQYHAQRWAGRLGWLTARRPWRYVDRLLARLPPAPSKKGAINKAKRFARGLRQPEDLEHARWWVFQDAAERREMLSPGMRRRLHGRDPLAFYRARLAEAHDAGLTGLQRRLYADVTGYLVDDILTKVDRMSMAVSLEARVPFLDHELVELAMAVPDRWKLRRGQGKWVLKEALRDDLPRAIRRRGKQGFSIPMKHWLRRDLAPVMSELLDERRMRERGWFRPDTVHRLMDEHRRGERNHAHRLWCLMALDLSTRNLEGRVRRRGPRARQEVHS